MLKAEKIGIVGASGWLGQHLASALLEKGYEVVAFSRSSRSSRSHVGLEWRQWTGEGEIDLAGLSAVVNLAGEAIDQRWTRARKVAFRQSRVDLSKNLVNSLATSEVQVLLNASATGFYGDRGEEELPESAGVGQGYLAELCRDWEGVTQGAMGVRVCQLRTGVVLGRGGRAWQKVSRVFKLGLGGKLGSGKQWMPWVHLDDEIRAIIHCLEGGLSGPVNLVAPESVTNRDFTKVLGEVLARPTIFTAPAFALRLALGEFAKEGLLASTRAIPEKLLESGFQFTHTQIKSAVQDCTHA